MDYMDGSASCLISEILGITNGSVKSTPPYAVKFFCTGSDKRVNRNCCKPTASLLPASSDFRFKVDAQSLLHVCCCKKKLAYRIVLKMKNTSLKYQSTEISRPRLSFGQYKLALKVADTLLSERRCSACIALRNSDSPYVPRSALSRIYTSPPIGYAPGTSAYQIAKAHQQLQSAQSFNAVCMCHNYPHEDFMFNFIKQCASEYEPVKVTSNLGCVVAHVYNIRTSKK